MVDNHLSARAKSEGEGVVIDHAHVSFNQNYKTREISVIFPGEYHS